MTGRDRMVLIVVSSLVVLAAAWLMLVSPERQKAAKLQSQVTQASAQLATAESQVASARSAQSRYGAAYAALVSLGKAVPPGREVPSLVYQLAQASNQKHVDFSSIVSGSGTAASGSSSSSSATATPAAAVAGFTQMPFTFVFNGTFSDLYHLFQQLNRFTVRTASGGLQVSGRLLTIQSTKLAPAGSGGVAVGSGKGSAEQLTGTITATAYVLPAAQGLTAGATAASPSSGSGSSTSVAAGASSPTIPPAIARVAP
jgi:Type II secretion system (T2SS), protein M